MIFSSLQKFVSHCMLMYVFSHFKILIVNNSSIDSNKTFLPFLVFHWYFLLVEIYMSLHAWEKIFCKIHKAEWYCFPFPIRQEVFCLIQTSYSMLVFILISIVFFSRHFPSDRNFRISSSINVNLCVNFGPSGVRAPAQQSGH